MATNFEIRLLLVLWDLGGEEVRKGELNGRFSGRTAEARESCASLVSAGAIVASTNGNLLTLTEAGKSLLSESLAGNSFEFNAQIGVKMANALLKWVRLAPVPSAEPVAKAVGSTIGSYEVFKAVALETFDRLNRDFNMDNLVPIYRIRREIGERVERSEFDRWLLEMQSSDVLQLIGGEMPELTPEIAQNSIKTALGTIRYYAQKL
jgi:hypothetical protein